MNANTYDNMTTDELAQLFSDFHKDVHGIRPRWVAHDDRAAILDGIASLNSRFDYLKSSREGREQLRYEGWVVTEFQAEDAAAKAVEEAAEAAAKARQEAFDNVTYVGKNYEQFDIV